MSKPERVLRALAHQSVDRVPVHDQLSYNPAVVAHYNNKPDTGFNFTVADIGVAVRRTLDMAFPLVAPQGKEQRTSSDGFVYQADEWTRWIVQRPFDTEEGARDWLAAKTQRLAQESFNPDSARARHRKYMAEWHELAGNTVMLDLAWLGFSNAIEAIGLELFVYMVDDYPEVFTDYMAVCGDRAVRHAHAVADAELSPVVLIPEDFATKGGPIFPPEFLRSELFPHVRRQTEAWQEHGVNVLYHTDGNYRSMIPDLIDTGVQGFYCLEPNVGMDIVELKRNWPQMTWAGSVDGVDLLERGTPTEVRAEVLRQIHETDALQGGVIIASSSEINPPIPLENYRAMVEAVDEVRNTEI
ncbi:MAG: uroporphyrinogen decarboxylase family protein [bacterium]